MDKHLLNRLIKDYDDIVFNSITCRKLLCNFSKLDIHNRILLIKDIRGKINHFNNLRKKSNVKDILKDLKNKLQVLEKDLYDILLSFPNKLFYETDLEVLFQYGVNQNKFGITHSDIIHILCDQMYQTHMLTKSRFVYLNNKVCKLLRSLCNYMINYAVDKNFIELYVPYMGNERMLINSGNLPRFKDDLFKTDFDLYMIPTSEVAILGYFFERNIEIEKLPIKIVCYSPCFRKEVGNTIDTKGIFRLHQFNKVEIFSLSHKKSSDFLHNYMVEHVSQMLKNMNIVHRAVLLPCNDISISSYKTIDIEVWLPITKKWIEISSISNCDTFQCVRSNIKCSNDGTFLHSLNGSSVAAERLIIAILEQFQYDDYVTMPNILVDSLGFDKIYMKECQSG